LVTIGVSIIAADLLLAQYGGLTYNYSVPKSLSRSIPLPGTTARVPVLGLMIIGIAVLVGAALWLLMSRTDLGRIVRAGIDDQQMIKALGYRVQLVFALIFTMGAGLAGLAGVLGGSLYSLEPGADSQYLVFALLVVIIGGLGSLPGTALGALLVGLVGEVGLTYMPAYALVLTFGLTAAVLAFRPRGLLGVIS
jgi:branched-chain amino acid transport system permease protein